ncbi:hypothetical protein U1737_00330 [Sphingomonas sp. LB3N6]|uniref:hypothetical protein n=1 Tax=Sphingomonas fucosidasi TaxID=3096164 RepID=UPI002FCBAC40
MTKKTLIKLPAIACLHRAAKAIVCDGSEITSMLRALAETEEAYSRTGRLLRRLKSFLPLGVASRAGLAGGAQ